MQGLAKLKEAFSGALGKDTKPASKLYVMFGLTCKGPGRAACRRLDNEPLNDGSSETSGGG